MFKFKKSALNTEDLAGIVIVMFVAAILIFAFTIFNVFNQSKKQKQIEVSIEDINADYNLNYFLRSQSEDNKIVVDVINEAYLSNGHNKVKILSDDFFKNIYELTGMNYDLFIGDRSLNSIDFAGILVSSSLYIPLIPQGITKVELAVGEPKLIMVAP